MEKLDDFIDKLPINKEKLVKEGNFFEYHFLDIMKEDWDKRPNVMSDFIIEQLTLLPQDVMAVLGIEKIFIINGITYFVRFKDRRREILADICETNEKIHQEIKNLKENPPAWASEFRDEYKIITTKHF
jgi:hypothetical protein